MRKINLNFSYFFRILILISSRIYFVKVFALDLKIIVSIDKEIKSFNKSAKTKKVRKGILPGNSKSLWKAVNIAKNINCTQLPDKLYPNGTEIPTSILADTFAEIFDKKYDNILYFNMISNRLITLNKQIPLQWLNLSLNSYKVKCKTLFF